MDLCSEHGIIIINLILTNNKLQIHKKCLKINNHYR
jgi:hypothetical protein